MKYIKLLNWDSEFFGYKVGELFSDKNNLSVLLSDAKKSYKLIYCKIDPLDVALNFECIKNNGVLVDEKVTYVKKNISKNTLVTDNTTLFEKNIADDDLIELTIQSGEFSRFKIDKNFKNNEFRKLYSQWIINSVKDDFPAKIIILKEREKNVGLLTLEFLEDRTSIGLLAVNKNFRSSGLGTQLVERAFSETNKSSLDKMQVVTQKRNIGGCLFYEKMGFEIEKVENIYHFWL